MPTITLSADEWISKLENAIASGNSREVANLKEALSKTDNVGGLFPSIYKRGRLAFARGDDTVAKELLLWLEVLSNGNWHAHLAAAEIRQKTEGLDEANRKFREHLQKNPVYRCQISSAVDKTRCAILLTQGKQQARFANGGFKLPSGLTEAEHLTKNKKFDVSMVFIEGISDQNVIEEFDVVINAISDADLYHDELVTLSRVMDKCSTPIINNPNATIRNTRCQLWAEARQGLPFVVPKTVRVRLNGVGKHEVPGIIEKEKFEYPVLFRPAGTQTGRGLRKFESARDAESVVEPGFYYISQFHDFRSADGYYRKYRFWNVGGEIVHNHVLIGEEWNVHGTSRRTTMTQNPKLREEDASYIEEGLPELSGQISALARATRDITGLDYFGVDYGVDPSGRIVVFEANATMRSYYPEIAESFPHANNALVRHVEAFERLIEMKAGQADSPNIK